MRWKYLRLIATVVPLRAHELERRIPKLAPSFDVHRPHESTPDADPGMPPTPFRRLRGTVGGTGA
jgi:hypothetical protein